MSQDQVHSHAAPAVGVGEHASRILALGLPLIGSRLAQFAIGMTDTLMMGWYDVTALAALTIAATLYFISYIVGGGFANAVSPLVASALGEGDTRQARRVTRMGLWLSLLYGAAVVPLFFMGAPLLRALGQDAEVARLGGQYLAVAGIGLLPGLAVMTLTSFLAAIERTRIIAWINISAALLNAGVNYILIFGKFGAPELGIVGAAIASLGVQFASLAAFYLFVTRRVADYALFQNIHRPDWPAFFQVARLGWPIGLTFLAEVGLFAAANVMVGWIGTTALAAHGIALQIATATFMVHLGLSQAATVRAGRAYGAHDTSGLMTGAGVALAMSLGFAITTMGLFFLIPDLLVGLFVDPTDPLRPEIIAVGATLLAFAGLFQVMDSSQVMALGFLRGVQDTKVPMWMALVSYWAIGFPASYGLGFGLGYGAPGIWLGLVIGLAAAAGFLNWRFWVRVPRQLA
ncbi:MAG: MATE family efflux transporter [Pseudomonadota bacterium]